MADDNAAAIQALIDGQNALQGAVQAFIENQQAPAANVDAALTPALAQTGVINYSSKAGSAVYESATKTLSTEFNFSAPNTRLLLQELSIRSENCGWKDILNVQGHSLLKEHTQVTLEQCKVHARNYLTFGDAAVNRNHQLDHQIYECVSSTLNHSTRQAMLNDLTKFQVLDENNENPTTSGVCFLKALLNKAEADSKIVASQTRRNIHSLSDKLNSIEASDIREFNDYVREQLATLDGMGNEHRMSNYETLQCLFDAYKTCPDNEFVAYIKRLDDRHNDPDDTMDLEPQSLLTRTETHYENAKARDLWLKKTADQEDIVALQATVKSLSAALKKKSSDSKSNSSGGGKSSSSTKKKYPSAPKKRDSDGRPVFEGKEKWRMKAPEEGKPKKKTIDSIEYIWCANHGYWGSHSTKDCRGGSNPYKKKKASSSNNTDQITASLAQIGVQDVASDEESE